MTGPEVLRSLEEDQTVWCCNEVIEDTPPDRPGAPAHFVSAMLRRFGNLQAHLETKLGEGLEPRIVLFWRGGSLQLLGGFAGGKELAQRIRRASEDGT